MAEYLQNHLREKRLFIAIILLLGISSWLFPESSSAITRLKTSGNRECAICHIMWLDEFKRKDVTPLIPYDPLPVEKTGKQDVSSTDQMCFSCHDGFVLDSRFLWKKERHNHPVGIKPSNDVTIPTAEGKTIFPMNEDGKVYCGTCHTAHGLDWDEKKNTTIFMRMDNRNSNICTACHLNRVTGPKNGNHPVHKKLKKLPPSLVRAGSRFSDNNEVICQSCHLAHGSKQNRMLAKSNHNSNLCASCHTQQAKVRNSKHDMSIMAPSSKNIRGEVVTESGPCSACHIPHKAQGPQLLWSRPISVAKDQGSAYCLNCHKESGIAHKKTINENSHPVDVAVEKVGIIAKKDGWVSRVKNKVAAQDIVKLPLFDKQGKRVKQGGNVTCMSCHDPHQWSAEHGKQASGDIHKTRGDGSNSFLRIANNKDSALCKNCHRNQASVGLSRHNLGITAPKETNKDGMTVSRSGVCSACHVPHNGKSEYMWARATKKNKGVMFRCISCHAKGKVAKNKTTGKHSHPLHVNLKKIDAATDLPLFTKDGKRDDKNGLIDCSTCHDPHQWDPANATAKSGRESATDGDASNSFLRLKASSGAALCVNCHKNKKTVIGTDHDLTVTAGKALNTLGQTVKQSGACGQCHAVHNAVLPQRLWAQKMGDGKHDAEKLCTGCHSKTGAAREKVPFKLTHPPRILSAGKARLSQDDNRKLIAPLFSADGKSVEAGMISCLTCHDPHQWDANKTKGGSGKNIEGDVRNSFLRHSSTEYFICSDCHAEESLYRYKYFHWSKSRPEVDPDKL